MKNKYILLGVLLSIAGSTFSQTVLYQDNLDSYALNSYLGIVNPTWWTTWSNAPGGGEDIQIKNTYAHSSPLAGSADKVGGQTDAILKLGNKVSGAYQLKWFMYVETGKCGYYNIQHMQSPGIEWAFEVYFRTAGTIELQAAGATVYGTYIKNQWMEVKHDIDLYKDSIWLYIDGVLLHKWKFSDQASAAGGTKQLGSVDFFAGEKSGSGEQPLFYLDDFYYAETASSNTPIISTNPTVVNQSLVVGSNGTTTLMLYNTGTGNLTYDVNIVYDLDNMIAAPVPGTMTGHFPGKHTLTMVREDPTPNPGIPNPFTDATAQLHYDGDNASAIGWNTVPSTVTVAARFPNAMTLPYAGMDLTSVEVYVNDLNTPPASNLMKIRIYGMDSDYEPGPLIYEQNFTPAGANWETIALNDPVKMTGEDLWVGYNFTQATTSIYIPGNDGGPANPNGDFFSTGIGWSHLAPGLDYNWNIRANLTGTVAPQWLTVAPMSGTVAPGGSTPLQLNFNTSNLIPGQYVAYIKILSNDNVNPVITIPVTLTALEVASPSISGTVRDATNIPVQGVTMTFTNISPATTVTDASGNYTMNVPYGYTGTSTPSKPNLTFSPQSRNYTNVSTNQTNQDFSATSSSNHFTPVWSGNPLYPMSIAVVQALLDGTDLVVGDEIGIFDGSLCVGAYQLITAINPSNPPFITVSKDDPGTPAIDGYTEGHPIVYKLWKSASNLEISSVTHTFPYAPSFAFETFVQNETAVVTLSGTSSLTLNTPLLAGWNMISFNVQPANMNLLSILQPLVTSGTLVKVIDEAGNIIQNFPWGWVNNVGNMAVTEGYYIKVTAACTLGTTGTPTAGSTTIPLATGWNMMGYPCQNQQNALTAVQPLINVGTLVKMIDEEGNILQYFPWGWVNNIGNLKAGEGYYIKVSAACSLTLVNASAKETECEHIPTRTTSHFPPPLSGNPFNPMAIAIQIEPGVFEKTNDGDEIGIYDGSLCVGGIAIGPAVKDNIIVTAFSDDPLTEKTDGFEPGAPVSFRYWNKNAGHEYPIHVGYLDGDRTFACLGTLVGKIESLPAEFPSKGHVANFRAMIYPNPFAEKASITFSLNSRAQIHILTLTPTGVQVDELICSWYDAGFHTIDFDARNLKSGVYLLQFTVNTLSDTFIETKRIIIAK